VRSGERGIERGSKVVKEVVCEEKTSPLKPKRKVKKKNKKTELAHPREGLTGVNPKAGEGGSFKQELPCFKKGDARKHLQGLFGERPEERGRKPMGGKGARSNGFLFGVVGGGGVVLREKCRGRGGTMLRDTERGVLHSIGPTVGSNGGGTFSPQTRSDMPGKVRRIQLPGNHQRSPGKRV